MQLGFEGIKSAGKLSEGGHANIISEEKKGISHHWASAYSRELLNVHGQKLLSRKV
jgi:hypothetical protein